MKIHCQQCGSNVKLEILGCVSTTGPTLIILTHILILIYWIAEDNESIRPKTEDIKFLRSLFEGTGYTYICPIQCNCSTAQYSIQFRITLFEMSHYNMFSNFLLFLNYTWNFLKAKHLNVLFSRSFGGCSGWVNSQQTIRYLFVLTCNQQPWLCTLQFILRYIEHLRCRIAASYWLSVHGHHYLSKMQWLSFFLKYCCSKMYLFIWMWLITWTFFLFLSAVLYCFLLSLQWNDWPVWFIIIIIIILMA